MIRKILIANRGEIACRIIRTCSKLGIATVAVYSDADADALHVRSADEAFHIGSSPASESYLHADKVIMAAKRSGADAIHPGYGFLSENPDFAQAVIDAGLVWIGPPVSAIHAMGKKREAKRLLQGIPLVPGYEGDDQTDTALIAAAEQIGFPIMVKASAGGGGKGMRRVDTADELPEALGAARREAQQAFGDDTLILEKYIVRPRHIEIQIFGDTHGTVIALGERECSIQRRHQKIIEEAPSTALTQTLRQQMCAVAISIGQQLGYTSAGTVEFLLDADQQFYFMEMNTRLQVEHPVTESIYGCDLVEWQIEIAEGRTPEAWSRGLQPTGHAIEVRLYAEDPANDFLPVIGHILHIDRPPDNVRVDTGVCSGNSVSMFYDPMLAKIIAYSPRSRDDAIRQLDHVLAQFAVLGLKHNLAFLRRVLTHPDFVAGKIHTHFVEAYPILTQDEKTLPAAALIAAAVAHYSAVQPRRSHGQHGWNSWNDLRQRAITSTFAANAHRYEIHLQPQGVNGFKVKIAGDTPSLHEFQHNGVDIEHLFNVRFLIETAGLMQFSLVVDGHRQQVRAVQSSNQWWIHLGGCAYTFEWLTPLPLPTKTATTEGSLRAPMTGQIMSIRVTAGQAVSKGDILLTLEAMKMEHRIQAPRTGVVEAIHYQVGDSVQADTVLLELLATDD